MVAVVDGSSTMTNGLTMRTSMCVTRHSCVPKGVVVAMRRTRILWTIVMMTMMMTVTMKTLPHHVRARGMSLLGTMTMTTVKWRRPGRNAIGM